MVSREKKSINRRQNVLCSNNTIPKFVIRVTMFRDLCYILYLDGGSVFGKFVCTANNAMDSNYLIRVWIALKFNKAAKSEVFDSYRRYSEWHTSHVPLVLTFRDRMDGRRGVRGTPRHTQV